MPLLKKWKCAFCEREFTREVWYKRHMCDKKKRFMEANSISVQKAHRLFNHWQQRTGLMRRSKTKTMEEFYKSPYFKLFVNFVEYTASQYVISAYTYLDWLVEMRVPSHKWMDRAQVEAFKTDYRKFQDPLEQAKSTVSNIRHWCAQKGLSVREFFTTIKPGEALNMVREGRLSPWVLFAYIPAVDMIERFDDDTLFTLDEFLNVDHWMVEVANSPHDTEAVVSYMEEAIGD